MKRQRTDTTLGTISAMRDALANIVPPPHVRLRERDLPFWESIVKARAASLWTEPDLEVAANLARCKSDIERLQDELDREGDVIINDRGTPIVNPKHGLLETLSRRCVALSKMLHVHAEATSGKSRDEQKANSKVADARSTVAQPDDDLIPRPTVN